MQAVETDRRTGHRISGLAASLLLHGAFLTLLLSLVPDKLEGPDVEVPIEVDFVPVPVLPNRPRQTGTPAAAPSPRTMPPSPQPDPSSSEQTAPPPAEVDAMIRPARMLSAGALAREGNAQARADLAGVSPEEYREQLCALEALEQIHVWNEAYVPERMVSYTFEEVRHEGHRLIAEGAAFWSREEWHRLSFECDLSPETGTVEDFAFQVGDVVPHEDWERYNLTRYK